MHQKPSLAENALSIFRKIRSAHWTDAAISLSASTLLGIPNRSLAVLMYRREDRGHDSQNAFAAFVHQTNLLLSLSIRQKEKLQRVGRGWSLIINCNER
jgi:hypothetical protein